MRQTEKYMYLLLFAIYVILQITQKVIIANRTYV